MFDDNWMDGPERNLELLHIGVFLFIFSYWRCELKAIHSIS